MREALRRAWEDHWFRPAAPLGVRAVRTLAAGQALWIALSRPDLPHLLAWPAPFWAAVDPALAHRFGIVGLPLAAEQSLFALLILALAAALLGIAPRAACAAAGLLLYHFAPLEEILIRAPILSFRGLTHPMLFLLLLSFAEQPRRGAAPSPEFRWPLALAQLLFSLNYFFAGLSKLYHAGVAWVSAEHVRVVALSFQQWGVVAPWADWVVASASLRWAAALGTPVLELAFPLALVSKLAARILVPLALAGHAGIFLSLGIFFHSAPMLLLFLDWDALDHRLRRAR
jgi:hypothetical protein